MILDQLNSIGALISQEGYHKTHFDWTPEPGADPVRFDISVKREATVADFEVINMQDYNADDRSVMARSVNRMVLIHLINGEPAAQERLSLEDCMRLKPSLLLAFFLAIGTVNKPAGKPAGKSTGKPPARRRRTKS